MVVTGLRPASGDPDALVRPIGKKLGHEALAFSDALDFDGHGIDRLLDPFEPVLGRSQGYFLRRRIPLPDLSRVYDDEGDPQDDDDAGDHACDRDDEFFFGH